jgi:hypothetical protein
LKSIFLLTLLFPLYKSIPWDPKTLAELKDSDFIYDTNNYIDRKSPSYLKILDYIREIQTEKKFLVFIYFISTVSPDYKTRGFLSTNVNIEKFVNDLAFFSENGNAEKDKNSIFILFSVEDRLNRIRTGENVKKLLTNDKASNYLKALKSNLKASKYTEALEDLMYKINYRLTKNTFWEDFWDSLLVYLFIFGVIYLCCIQKRDNYQPYVQDNLAEIKLEKIKKISENNKDNFKFLEDNCIICLEEFTEEEKNKLLKNKNKEENESNNIDVINNNPPPKENNLLIDFNNKEEKNGNTNIIKEEKNSNLTYGKYFLINN